MKKTLALAVAAWLTAGAASAQVKTVFVIAFENHNFMQPAAYTGTNQILGNPAAPFINSLITPGSANAAMVSFASAYGNVPGVHPSEPNYVWAESGVHGPLNDRDPYPNNIVSAPNLSALLQAAGKTWKSYQEDIDLLSEGGRPTSTVAPQDQWVVPLVSLTGTSSSYVNAFNGSHQYGYAAKHNPQLFFSATNGGDDPSPANPQAKDYAPLQQLASDLDNNTVANYNWITPNLYNDMHTALPGGFSYKGTQFTGDQAAIAQGDNFLSQVIPLIEASQAFKDNGVIIIWNDETEGEGTVAGTFSSMEIVISPLAKGNAYNGAVAYTHSSDLRTEQEIFGLTPAQGGAWLGDAANATDLGDLFQPGAIAAASP
jgi:hypothetical protein